jgi:hypothetical protein
MPGPLQRGALTERNVASSQASFGLDLLHAVHAQRPGENVLLSPTSAEELATTAATIPQRPSPNDHPPTTIPGGRRPLTYHLAQAHISTLSRYPLPEV